SRVTQLRVSPVEQTVKPGEEYQLRVQAAFADGTEEDVTALATFESRDKQVATVEASGRVRAAGVGDAALIVRYRATPALAMVLVPRPAQEAFPQLAEHNFIDKHIL